MSIPSPFVDGQPQLLFGRKALQRKFEMCSEDVANGQELDMHTVMQFRTFGWMMSKEDYEKAELWIHTTVVRRADKAIADVDTGGQRRNTIATCFGCQSGSRGPWLVGIEAYASSFPPMPPTRIHKFVPNVIGAVLLSFVEDASMFEDTYFVSSCVWVTVFCYGLLFGGLAICTWFSREVSSTCVCTTIPC